MRFSGRFRLRRRLKTLFQRVKFRTSTRHRFRNSSKPGGLSWFQRARFTLSRALGSTRLGSGYVRVGQDDPDPNPAPKGYLAVYVERGSNEVNGEWERVLVPVMELNHPLFRELLKAAEAEFGFEHPGGITIPCRISELESVRTRIESGRAGLGCRSRLMTWRKEKSWG